MPGGPSIVPRDLPIAPPRPAHLASCRPIPLEPGRVESRHWGGGGDGDESEGVHPCPVPGWGGARWSGNGGGAVESARRPGGAGRGAVRPSRLKPRAARAPCGPAGPPRGYGGATAGPRRVRNAEVKVVRGRGRGWGWPQGHSPPRAEPPSPPARLPRASGPSPFTPTALPLWPHGPHVPRPRGGFKAAGRGTARLGCALRGLWQLSPAALRPSHPPGKGREARPAVRVQRTAHDATRKP